MYGGAGRALFRLPIETLREAFSGHIRAGWAAEEGAMPEKPRILVLHAPGTSRDRDAALACTLAGGAPEIVHVNQILSGEREFAAFQMLVLPGGSAYGDDLGAGRLWGHDLAAASVAIWTPSSPQASRCSASGTASRPW